MGHNLYADQGLHWLSPKQRIKGYRKKRIKENKKMYSKMYKIYRIIVGCQGTLAIF